LCSMVSLSWPSGLYKRLFLFSLPLHVFTTPVLPPSSLFGQAVGCSSPLLSPDPRHLPYLSERFPCLKTFLRVRLTHCS
jgi:hypothetical protein